MTHSHAFFSPVRFIASSPVSYILPNVAAVILYLPGDSSVSENVFSLLIVFLSLSTLAILLGDFNINVCDPLRTNLTVH